MKHMLRLLIMCACLCVPTSAANAGGVAIKVTTSNHHVRPAPPPVPPLILSRGLRYRYDWPTEQYMVMLRNKTWIPFAEWKRRFYRPQPVVRPRPAEVSVEFIWVIDSRGHKVKRPKPAPKPKVKHHKPPAPKPKPRPGHQRPPKRC